jgi:monoterpene epsilon-lactone hydrolase
MMTSTELGLARTMFETMMVDATASGEATTIDEMRAAYDKMCSKLDIPTDARITDVEIAGVPCIDVRTADGEPDRTIVWLHSGGYAIGSPAGYRSLGAHLSAASGARVVLVDYRLAPEHPFPAALEDAAAVYRAVISEQHGGAEQCVLAGDSAGGGLVIATLVALRDNGDALPSCAVCCSPWVDLAQTGDSLDSNAAIDPAVSRGMLEMCTSMYLGDRDRYNPLASPLYADLAGLPPLFVLVGTAETLLDDARRITDRASAAGVDATLRVADDMIHIFPLFVSFLPEAKDAVAEIGEFISGHARQPA